MQDTTQQGSNTMPLVLSWAFVGIPLAWGVYNTLSSAVKLFK